MKKYSNIILTIILFIFSFYYTKKCINFLKMNDNLMQEIINKRYLYEKESTDAIVTSNTMIPGIKGKIIERKWRYCK